VSELWFNILIFALQSVVLFFIVATGFAYLTLFERKLLARFQNRVGPNRAGPGGFLQPAADAVKLFFKEDIVPRDADKWMYLLAPVLATVPAIVIWAVIPLGCWIVGGSFNPGTCALPGDETRNVLQLTDVNVGVLYLLAITSIGVYGIALAGWASANKYSMLGGIRAAAQVISYELALGMSILSAAMMAGSFSTAEIVNTQYGMWFIIPQLLGFFIFIISASAEVVRAPFDLVEAEQELAGGYNVEYGSMKFALFFMAEYIKLIAVSAMAVTLFLGGWRFPGLGLLGDSVASFAGLAWGNAVVGLASLLVFVLKVTFFLFLSIWIRASLPRIRYDKLMDLGWKWLLPMALFNLAATAVVVVVGQSFGLPPLVQNLILFVIGLGVIIGVSSAGSPQRLPAPSERETTYAG
jgi:NADH-quinone oxidoreductase subunit H